MTTLEQFLATAEVPVGMLEGTPRDGATALLALPEGWVGRTVRGEMTPTVAGVFDEFAAAWQFPYYFGANKNAFDECMRELDETVGPASGYVLLVRDAEQLLRAEPGELAWFADAMAFYAEHWAGEGVAFRVLLQVGPGAATASRRAWGAAGAEPALVTLVS